MVSENFLKAWPYPREIAHRGGGALAPENTLAAMRCGLAHGFQGVEFDAMLASDGIPVLMHDPHFGRTINAPGGVQDYAADALTQMDAGAWMAPQFRGEPVCTLWQAMQFCFDHDLWMNIEIKPATNAVAAETGRMVAQQVREFFAAEYAVHMPGVNDAMLPLLSSFSVDALLAARTEAPGIPRGWLVDAVGDDWQRTLEALSAVALHTNHRYLTPALAASIKQAGYGLFCYTVNDPARAVEIAGWGVDGFCTDRLDLFPQTHV
jgi:glycerophosphoryl diester phosphodiesterase